MYLNNWTKVKIVRETEGELIGVYALRGESEIEVSLTVNERVAESLAASLTVF